MSLKHRLGFQTEPIYLIDGTAFLYRGFFANANMTRSDGLPTGALYIVGRVLLKLLRDEQPEYLAFIMDGKGPNFRHELYPDYKANRPPTPEGLKVQVEPVREMIRALGLHLEVSDQCEADDCIASLCKRFQGERPVVIVGMDKDLRQCLTPNVVLWDPSSREEKLVTLDSFRADTGLEPSQWPDVQALIGDSSDNIPGVRGIGPKTAETLFKDFKSLEDIRDRFDQVPEKIKKKLEGNLDAMFLYRQLTTLDTARCTSLSLDDFKLNPANGNEALTLFSEYEMGSLKRELSQLLQSNGVATSASAKKTAGGTGGQFSLFSSSSPAPEHEAVLDILERADQLPPCQGAVLAMTPPPAQLQRREDGSAEERADCFLALERQNSECWQAHYRGPQADLAAWAGQAALLVVPDWKKVLHQHPAWWTLTAQHCFDLSLAAYLLAPEDRDYSWPRLSARHAEASGISHNLPAKLALSLHQELSAKLDAADLTPLLRQMELPLVPVLAAMEEAGIKVDLDALHAFLSEVQAKLESLTADIYEAAGGEFNIRSAQQIGEVLYKRLGLPSAKSTKGGQASTSQDVLEKLSGHHPVVDKLLAFRKLEKMRSTYLEPLPRLTGPDGRIRTNFNQTATATGRLSSSNPNLQNIPIRGDMGGRMRSCFTAEEGNALISADYSQVELRVLAHYSQDPTLLAAFRNGEDIHTRTAALLHDIDPAQVSREQRRGAKTINFGLIYGMGARKLANELAISQSEAKEFIERYFARFSKIKEFYDGVEQQAREQGFVTTLSGRRRPLPDMHSQSAQARALAERQAVNTLIQGSAADIIKLAMLAVYNDAELKKLSAALLLQVHDELVLECPWDAAEAAGKRLAELMNDLTASGIELSIPLLVDWSFGRDWGSAH